MEVIAYFTAFCGEKLHVLASMSPSLPLALLLAGLAGSLVHCVGMCGPFVLGQVVADSEHAQGKYGEWQRLAGAALLPYHFGRLTTYTALGAIAGAATALFAATTGFAWLSAVLLVIGALLMILQALGLALGAASPLSGVVARLGDTPLAWCWACCPAACSMVRWLPPPERAAPARRRRRCWPSAWARCPP
jgi:uncharacterized protein